MAFNDFKPLREVDEKCRFPSTMLWAWETPWPATISNFRRASRVHDETAWSMKQKLLQVMVDG
jgi:hypothetical protein